MQLLNIVSKNLKLISLRQQERAKKARKAFQEIWTPTTQEFKTMICMNLIKNTKITKKDIDMAEEAYGPDIGAIKDVRTQILK